MGDGGGCHPRQYSIKLVVKQLRFVSQSFDNIMKQRENQTDWMADLVISNS